MSYAIKYSTAPTANQVAVGDSVTNTVKGIAVGSTGTLLVGSTAAAPAFGSSADGGFTFTTASAGTTRTLFVTNTDNTNAASHAQQTLTTGGASGGDPKTTYTVSGVTSFSTGLDNSSADEYKISQSTNIGTNDTFIMTTTGERTMPLQPAFLALNSATDSNVTGDNTTYTIICDTEIYDQGSDYNNATGTFSAPVTGRYLFTATAYLLELTAAHTSLFLEIATSNRDARGYSYSLSAGVPAGALEPIALCYVDMDAGDNANLRLRIAGSTKTVDVYGEASGALYTSFAGALIC